MCLLLLLLAGDDNDGDGTESQRLSGFANSVKSLGHSASAGVVGCSNVGGSHFTMHEGSQTIRSSASLATAPSGADPALPPHAPCKAENSPKISAAVAVPLLPTRPQRGDSSESDDDDDDGERLASIPHPAWVAKKEEVIVSNSRGLTTKSVPSTASLPSAAAFPPTSQAALRAVSNTVSVVDSKEANSGDNAREFLVKNPAAMQIVREAKLQSQLSTKMAEERAAREREEARQRQREQDEAKENERRRESEAKRLEAERRRNIELRKQNDRAKRAVSFLFYLLYRDLEILLPTLAMSTAQLLIARIVEYRYLYSS